MRRMSPYPHTIENGAGERLTFIRRVGDRLEVENVVTCTGYVEPADNLEYFLTALYDSQRKSGGKRPDPFEAAFLARRYRSEFGMAEIPAPVQQLVFPLLVALGRVLGKSRKYAHAPEPVRR
jgi:hypothetical protein